VVGGWEGARCPLPFPSASVIDADEVLGSERPPSHPVEVEVDDEVLGRSLAIGLGAERLGNQVEAGRARCGARLSADLGEGELDGTAREAGTEGSDEVGRHGGLLVRWCRGATRSPYPDYDMEA